MKCLLCDNEVDKNSDICICSGCLPKVEDEEDSFYQIIKKKV